MTKQLWLGLCAVAMLSALSACSEVENCKKGTAGCVDGPPKDGKCLYDLELSGGKCVEPGQGGDGDDDGSDGDGGDGSDEDCTCPNEGELCNAGNCVAYCEVPEKLPGSKADSQPEEINCYKLEGEPDLTFAEACLRRCKITAQRQEWFCDDAPVTCGEADAPMLAACALDCPADDVPCLQDQCQATLSAGCNDTTCADDSEPECAADLRCSNDCGGELNYDGWCDDGDTFNTSDAEGSQDSALCPWGTDCADCGPRYGDDVPENIPEGGQCHFNSRCEGHKQVVVGGKNVADLETNRSWCASLTQPVVGNFRCVPDASGEGEKCPAGYATVDLGMEMNGLTAKACIPPANFCE